jgi:thiol:disulfide interchange protein
VVSFAGHVARSDQPSVSAPAHRSETRWLLIRFRETITMMGMKLGCLIVCIISAAFLSTAFAAEGVKNLKLYDTNAIGSEQIKAALEKAQKENKNVLLKFGANWCGWCHRLSAVFHENKDVAKVLNDNYVLVLIDVDKGHNADVVKRYGEPTRYGLPVLVVLDQNGKQLHTQDTGKLEDGDHHDPTKVIAFLEKWKPQSKS